MRIQSAIRPSLFLPALLLGFGLRPMVAQSSEQTKHEHEKQADPDHAVSGGGAVPAGWSVRPDDAAGAANVKVVEMGKGLHVTLGPAIILYQTKHAGNGPFHTLATFTLTKPAKHPEGYGLFYGGKALDGKGQKYTYFLVRGTGEYLVKVRDGADTRNVVEWKASDAVPKADASGKASYTLKAHVAPDTVHFSVNGKLVAAVAKAGVPTDGVAGLRINHNLHVAVTPVSITK